MKRYEVIFENFQMLDDRGNAERATRKGAIGYAVKLARMATCTSFKATIIDRTTCELLMEIGR